ncbi:MAG: hypothetical protein ABIZ70_01660 [Gemmatimonadales bacterium]
MYRRLYCLTAVVLFGACADHDTTTLPHTPLAATPAPSVANTARERLARRLATALADPTTRATLARRLARSHAPEGKLQFQALVRADEGALLATLARQGATSVTELLADLTAARNLEIYLPVEAQRAAWQGSTNYLVATQDRDGDAPVAFDATGHRSVLDASRPPTTPVIALVPQETDFTGGRPALAMTCYDMCTPTDDGGGGSGGGGTSAPAGATGLMLTQSHFDDYYESWIKGKPEFEYHVYGVGDGGEAVQLACTGEHSGGSYIWDQNELDWHGSAMLLTESDRAAYETRHPGSPVRIVAYEDDDEACVPRVDAGRVTTLLSAVDAAYKSVTSGKVEPWLYRGIKAAPSVFALLRAVRNIITTSDDLIGTAVEATVAGSAPEGANWTIKTDGTKTTGWFTTVYQH